MNWRIVLPALALAALLLWLPHSAPAFHAMFPTLGKPVYLRTGFGQLVAIHAGIVLLASATAVLVGLAVAALVTRPFAGSLLPTANAVAVVGQTIPPVAVLVLSVPLLGFGAPPTLLALTVYGVLPVLGQAIAGLRSVPPDAIAAADGMGYGPWRRLKDAELPLAVPAIMSGVRLSVIVAVGTATIGSTVGATTLGSPIVEGLVGNNPAYVVQGALLVAALAMLFDGLLEWVERRVTSRGR
jgi:osmoprotectant transport system permease protein